MIKPLSKFHVGAARVLILNRRLKEMMLVYLLVQTKYCDLYFSLNTIQSKRYMLLRQCQRNVKIKVKSKRNLKKSLLEYTDIDKYMMSENSPENAV